MTERSRRRFIAYTSGTLLTAGVSSRVLGQDAPKETPQENSQEVAQTTPQEAAPQQPVDKNRKIRYGMLHDETKCLGSACLECVRVCRETNKVPEGVTRLNIVQIVDIPKSETQKKAIKNFFRVSCQQCENPSCVTVCPTGASYIDPETGIVDVHEENCVGCKYCLAACPYQVRYINPETHSADKCNFCRNTNLAEGKEPACVANCPVKALTFGDLNDPESNISQALQKNATYRTKVNLGNEPKLYHVPSKYREINDA